MGRGPTPGKDPEDSHRLQIPQGSRRCDTLTGRSQIRVETVIYRHTGDRTQWKESGGTLSGHVVHWRSLEIRGSNSHRLPTVRLRFQVYLLRLPSDGGPDVLHQGGLKRPTHTGRDPGSPSVVRVGV